MKKMFRRIIIILLSALLVFFAGACINTPDPVIDPPDPIIIPPDPPDPPDPPGPVEPVLTKVTQEELFEKMTGSIYTDLIECDIPTGLSKPHETGVDKAKFEEVKYPLPADSEFAEIYNVSDSGILPSNSAALNVNKLEALLYQIKDVQGKKKIFFPEGVYKFDGTINMYQYSDVYFCGDKTEWMMTEWLTILSINEGSNIHINNIDFDYETSPTVSGKVTAVNAAERKVSILIDDEFDMTDYRYNGGKIKTFGESSGNYGNYMEYLYDAENECYVPDIDGMLRYNSPGDQVSGITNGVYEENTKTLTFTFNTVQGAFKAPAIGKQVSAGYTMYEYTGFLVKNSENFYMESCNIYTTPGMSITCYSDENLYFNRTNIMLRPGTKRLMTATADGLHTIDCFGDLIVTNSIYEASHDDAMNICTFYFRVNSFSRSKLTCTATTTEVNYPIRKGDTIEIYDNTSMELLYTRVAQEVTNYGITYEVTFDQSLPTKIDITNCFVANATRVPRLKVDNCIIRNKRNRGILAQVQDSQITNCAFYNIVHGPIMIHSAQDIFAEAIVPRDVTVKNCKFFSNNSGQGLSGDVAAFRHGGTVKAGTITGIKVENNFFYKSCYSGVYFSGTGGCEATNNLFYDIATRNSSSASVRLNIADKTTVTDNFTYMTVVKSGFTFLKQASATETTESGNTGHNI